MRKHHREYVTHLGLDINELNYSVIEDIVAKASNLMEVMLKERLPARRVIDFDTVICFESSSGTLKFKVMVELRSSTPLNSRYKGIIDDVIDEVFNFIERSLVEVGSSYV